MTAAGKINQSWLTVSIMLNSILVFAWSLTGCYSDYGLSTDDYDVVATFYDENVDYSSFKTYVMPDTIFHIIGEDGKDELGRDNDQLILSLIVQNMTALGYRRVTNPQVENPDVGIVIAASSTTTTEVYYSYAWGGYWGYPGYGYYYPPYWWGPAVTSYTSGTVFINMADPKAFSSDQKLLATVWLATINGLLEDTKANIRTRLASGINKAYEQSPYLKVAN
jgi:hypothetical protein